MGGKEREIGGVLLGEKAEKRGIGGRQGEKEGNGNEES